MIYESNKEKFTWGHHREWLLWKVCDGDEGILDIVRDGCLEIIGAVEDGLEELFPGATFEARFFALSLENDITDGAELRFGISDFDYFARLWEIEIDENGVILPKDVLKVADKKELVNLVGYYRPTYAFLGSVELIDSFGLKDIMAKYNERLLPHKVWLEKSSKITVHLKRWY